ncbi:hypothetical protein [Escherichia coli]|uniref:hypothetical protein n=1 Tax=Escherichia coli TaxID=562 RepID=UPI001D0CAE7B|nr:hypothetical protein [Escherichia coli]ELH7430887.1 hypothetical protein [Escherichia coli]
MKYFNQPLENDIDKITEIANANYSGSKLIENNLNIFIERYKEYYSCKGAALSINGMFGLNDARESIKKLYKSKGKQLSFIKELRDKNTGKCCSMCGANLSTQIDHFLPQEFFLEYSILSANLIPICKCNQKKGKFTIGDNIDEILLHPRYEKKLSKRIITAKIRNHDGAIEIYLEFNPPKKISNAKGLAFHYEKIVDSDLLITTIRERFYEMKRAPSSVVYTLADRINSPQELRNILFSHLRSFDKRHQSQNNWESIFIHALLEKRTFNWIWRKISAPDRKYDESF